MSFEFWGLKDVALFDLWSFIHILAGISIGFLVILMTRKWKIKKKEKMKINFIILLSIIFFWEILEYLFEIGVFGLSIMNWFYGTEFFLNRLIIDPSTFLLGSFIIYKKQNRVLFSFAIIISLTWLLIHIFIFPNVIYLQNLT